jgi:hypothetical protein
MLIVALGAFAQSQEPKISLNVEGFRYPRIAALAGIEGEFVFAVSGSERRLVSQQSNVAERGKQRLLAEPAQKNLDTWTLPRLDRGRYEVRYRFVILHEPACESESRTFPAETSVSRSGDDVLIEVLVKATRGCAQP